MIWKRDDATASGESELRESGVSGEKDGKKDGGSESLNSRGDPSKSMGGGHACVVGKSGEKAAEPVVVASPGGDDATADKSSVESRTSVRVRRVI